MASPATKGQALSAWGRIRSGNDTTLMLYRTPNRMPAVLSDPDELVPNPGSPASVASSIGNRPYTVVEWEPGGSEASLLDPSADRFAAYLKAAGDGLLRIVVVGGGPEGYEVVIDVGGAGEVVAEWEDSC